MSPERMLLPLRVCTADFVYTYTRVHACAHLDIDMKLDDTYWRNVRLNRATSRDPEGGCQVRSTFATIGTKPAIVRQRSGHTGYDPVTLR